MRQSSGKMRAFYSKINITFLTNLTKMEPKIPTLLILFYTFNDTDHSTPITFGIL